MGGVCDGGSDACNTFSCIMHPSQIKMHIKIELKFLRGFYL